MKPANKITPGECEARELERINQTAERLNSAAKDVLEYQITALPRFSAAAKKRGRGRPRHTS